MSTTETIDDVSPLPHGPAEALTALHKATARVAAALDGIFSGEGAGPIWAALSEALFWVAALEDEAERAPGYFTRRNADPGGLTVGGLVYARNMHAHELVTAGEVEWVVGSVTAVLTPPGEPPPEPGRGMIFGVRLRWVPLSKLPPPRETEKHGRDEMYRDHVEGRLLTEPLHAAATWLASMLPQSSPEVSG